MTAVTNPLQVITVMNFSGMNYTDAELMVRVMKSYRKEITEKSIRESIDPNSDQMKTFHLNKRIQLKIKTNNLSRKFGI